MKGWYNHFQTTQQSGNNGVLYCQFSRAAMSFPTTGEKHQKQGYKDNQKKDEVDQISKRLLETGRVQLQSAKKRRVRSWQGQKGKLSFPSVLIYPAFFILFSHLPISHCLKKLTYIQKQGSKGPKFTSYTLLKQLHLPAFFFFLHIGTSSKLDYLAMLCI